MDTIKNLQKGNQVTQAKVFCLILVLGIAAVLILNQFHVIDLSALKTR